MDARVSPNGPDFFDRIGYLSPADRGRVRQAFELSQECHGGQQRASGEPYFTHPLAVASYLAEYRLDANALIAALLHDAAEDTRLSLAEIEAAFGPQVAQLVDGVTKLKEVAAGAGPAQGRPAEQAASASMHKLLNAGAADRRITLIKLFDRLHNMRTIKALPRPKQEVKAAETLSVYAPLANRLGMWRLKTELEELALEVIDNQAYSAITQTLEQLERKRRRLYTAIVAEVRACLAAAELRPVDVRPLPPSVSGVYKGLKRRKRHFSQIDVPLRALVLLEDEAACFQALGALHACWKPVPGRFDDYINRPRENLYKGLHTTVVYRDGAALRLRLRTPAMHEVSEVGELAKWLYGGTRLWNDELAGRLDGLATHIKQLMQSEPEDRSGGVQAVVEDLFSEQLMINTPKGDVLELPRGATALDFAYAVHTEVGHRAQSALVDEAPAPLTRKLRDGQQVEIVKAARPRPQRAWLDDHLGYLVTRRAKGDVRRWFRKLPAKQQLAAGRDLLQAELSLLGREEEPPERVAALMGLPNAEALYQALGTADRLPEEVAVDLLSRDWYREPGEAIGQPVETAWGEARIIDAAGRALRLCGVCKPRPGDPILGVVRDDGRVRVHRQNCRNLPADPEARRTIKLDWARADAQEARTVHVLFEVYDRSGLLVDITTLVRDEGVNIWPIHTLADAGDGLVRFILGLSVASPRQLVGLLHRARALNNVAALRCLSKQEAAQQLSALAL